MSFLRPAFARAFPSPWILGLLVFVMFAAWRGYLLLGPARGSGPAMASHFVLLMATPFLLLGREGHAAIGLNAPRSYAWLGLSAGLGAASAVAFGVAGFAMFGGSTDNWYVAIGDSLLRDPRLAGLPTSVVLPMLAIPAAIFSPLGEEAFFRGYLQESLALRWGEEVASWGNGAAFGLMHLFHHGITVGAQGVEVHLISGLVWLILIIGLSAMFTLCRRRGGSLWCAVLSHSAFNVTMVAFIIALRD